MITSVLVIVLIVLVLAMWQDLRAVRTLPPTHASFSASSTTTITAPRRRTSKLRDRLDRMNGDHNR